MPQFELNTPWRKHAYDDLDELARGYVEAMFFTNGDTADERENLLNELGVQKLTRASVKRIKRDCNKFTGIIMPDGCFVRQWLDRFPKYSDEQAGRDLWFTRQGHGVGFWERQELGEAGDALSDAARTLGEHYVYVNRGWIHAE